MIFVPARGELKNGTITVVLNKPLNSCMIGLLDFSIPSINSKRPIQNSIDISCDQIDSTFWNPKRILNRLCFNRVIRFDYYNTWTAPIIEFHQVDSNDKFLTFNITRTIGDPSRPTTLDIDFENKITNEGFNVEVFFTIAIKPMTVEESRWNCI